MEKRRVVITGLGSVNPIGLNVEEYWEGLMSGRSGISLVDRFDASEFSTRFAAQITGLNFSDHFDSKEARRTSQFVMLAVIAAKEAIAHSGFDVAAHAERIGVEIGSGIGGLEVLEAAVTTLNERGPSKMSPFTVPMMIADMATGMVAMKTGAKGPNSATVTACASSTHAIGNAMKIIERGQADAMITGGSEACITPVGLGSFCAARSLSQRNDDIEHACRPFDNEREGFVMGEGSGILILEEYEFAKARGATILGEVVGFGSSGDAYHITAPAPEGEGAQRAMKAALADAGLNPDQVDYVNAHGTSTKLNDRNETMAMKKVFGDHAYKMAISSTKSMTGHLLGAAGAIEAVACVKVMQTGIVPPTINYEFPDPECDLNYTPNVAQERKVNVTMSNSFGFGGHNAVLILKKV
jgi:3-oxoacyl-[acyl-carrier-protein] synthase II